MPEHPLTSPNQETIYLIGTSGHPNYGDEFIAAAWLRFLAKVRPDADVVLDCPQPGLASFLFEGLHPRLKTTDMLWRVVWETTDMDPEEGNAHVDRLMTQLGTPRYDLGLLAARRATTVHLIGGGHINTIWPHHVRLLRAALLLGEVSGARVVATGLGLMPAQEPESVRGYIGQFDHATVRDAASAELSGGELTADDAFLDLAYIPGFAERTAATGGEPGDVWVCVQNDLATPEAFDTTVEAVRSVLKSPALEGRTVRYVEALPGVDRFAYDRLSDLIPEENFVPFVKLWNQEFPGRPGQVWLTTRFHLHLLAASCGAAGTAFEVNDDYYRVKHQSLIEAGTGWAVTPSGSAVGEQPSGGGEGQVTARRLNRVKLNEAEQLYPRIAPVSVPRPAPAKEPQRAPSLFRRRG